MRWLASYVMKGPVTAALVAALAGLLSLLQPPLTWLFAYIGAGTVALVTLQVGARQGLLVLVTAVAAAGGFTALALPFPAAEAVWIGAGWLPVWAAGWLLARSRSLAWTLQWIGLLGAAAVIAAYVVMPDPAAHWLQVIEPLRPMLAQAGQWQDPAELDRLLEIAAQVMTGVLAAWIVLGTVLGLLVGRAWQALLYRPGALREEFAGLRLGRMLAGVTLVLGVLGVGLRLAWAGNAALALGVVFFFGGLAVAHGIAARWPGGSVWLVGLYVLMLLALPQMMLLLALVALADSWLDFRGRLQRRAGR